MINREIEESIKELLEKKRKVIVLYGPRQVGKTTLLKKLFSEDQNVLVLNGEESEVNRIFSSNDSALMLSRVKGYDSLVIDEAQNIQDIGINIKILYDKTENLQIVLTGSSSFELANRTSEPLTGRKRLFTLYPISLKELCATSNIYEVDQNLESFLIYGMYPEVVTEQSLEDKKEALNEITTSYLYKDIIALTQIKHSDKLHKLLQLLALQIGSTVSLSKLSNQLDISFETVENYIDLLEKTFVIYRLKGYSRNKAKEISKMDKIYFYDVGIRNQLINSFSPLELRTDVGALWENFIINERLKHLEYSRLTTDSYFWRLYSGAEIDYIEMSNGVLNGYEIKWNKKRQKEPLSWKSMYPKSTYTLINRSNYMDFIGVNS